MILEAENAVRHVAPDLLGGGKTSVACVQTTRPKYLIFAANVETPVCVVQFGEPNELERVHRILQRLEPLLAGMVPTALALGPFRSGVSVQVQSGLSGSPWFRVRQECRSQRDWMRLLARAMDTLRQLQSAVAQIREWKRVISPAEELRAQLRSSLVHVAISEDTVRRVQSAADALESMGKIETFAQHGDFALNNLLIGHDLVRVIDFDEFGLTFMPLHDETGLALSMLALAPAGVTTNVLEYLDVVLHATGSTFTQAGADEHALAFVLHHVLWRINQCHGVPRREQVKNWLLGYLGKLAAALPSRQSALDCHIASSARCC